MFDCIIARNSNRLHLFLCSARAMSASIFLRLVRGHTFKVLISAAVQKKIGGDGRRHSDKRMHGEFEQVEREGVFCPSSVAEQLWLCASMGNVPTRRQCVANADCNTERFKDSKRDAGRTQVCLWGVSEADWQERFGLHLHVKCPGCDPAARNSRGKWAEISWAVLCHQTITYHRLHANNTA